MERGEVSGRTVDLSTLRTFRPQWLVPGGGMRASRHADFPDVPTARELAATPAARTLIELTELPYSMARPFMAPPDIPPERAAALRSAFIETHMDPQFVDEAARLRLDVSPVGGAAILQTIERMANASPATLDHVRRLLTPDKNGG
jgi:hypothetical protein